MLALIKFFLNPFNDLKISLQRLIVYAARHLQLLMGESPGPEFAARITATAAALTALDTSMGDQETKAAVASARAQAKKEFRQALPPQIARISAAAVLAYGENSVKYNEIFPHGRNIFTRCTDEQLNDHLQATVAGLNANATGFTPALLAEAAALLSNWEATRGAVGTTQTTKELGAGARQALRAALARELFKNVLTLALAHPDDAAICEKYCPEYLLRVRASSVTPGIALLTLVNYNPLNRQADFTITAKDAESFRVYRRMVGEADWSLWAEDIVPVDGVATYSIGLNTAGNFEFVAEGVNGTRVGERSTVVLVQQTN